MKHGLMGKEKIENLGFTDVNSWDSEKTVIIAMITVFIEKARLV